MNDGLIGRERHAKAVVGVAGPVVINAGVAVIGEITGPFIDIAPQVMVCINYKGRAKVGGPAVAPRATRVKYWREVVGDIVDMGGRLSRYSRSRRSASRCAFVRSRDRC